MLIRKALSSDLGSIMALLAQLWPGEALHAGKLRAAYEAMLASDVYELICAEWENVPVGFASASVQMNLWQQGRIMYITTMIVDRPHRRQGIGTALVREMERIAGARGCGRIELESAFHRTDAHAFYEHAGFEPRALFLSKKTGGGRRE